MTTSASLARYARYVHFQAVVCLSLKTASRAGPQLPVLILQVKSGFKLLQPQTRVNKRFGSYGRALAALMLSSLIGTFPYP